MNSIEVTIGKTKSSRLKQQQPDWFNNLFLPKKVNKVPSIEVLVKHECIQDIFKHTSNTILEAGGILVGEVYKWRRYFFVEIVHSIPGSFLEASETGLKFTVEAWLEMIDQKNKEFPKSLVVGWFHSHPFMSTMMSFWDITLHRGFFPEPWQVSLVVDPYREVLNIYQFIENGFCLLDNVYIREDHSVYRITKDDAFQHEFYVPNTYLNQKQETI